MPKVAENLNVWIANNGQLVISCDPRQSVGQSDRGHDKIAHAQWLDLGNVDPSLAGCQLHMVIIRKNARPKTTPRTQVKSDSEPDNEAESESNMIEEDPPKRRGTAQTKPSLPVRPQARQNSNTPRLMPRRSSR